MKLRYTATALIELDAILTYVRERDVVAADRIAERVDRTLDHLLRFPESSVRRADEPNTRMALVGRFPYRIFYTVEGTELVILHIRHTARRMPELS